MPKSDDDDSHKNNTRGRLALTPLNPNEYPLSSESPIDSSGSAGSLQRLPLHHAHDVVRPLTAEGRLPQVARKVLPNERFVRLANAAEVTTVIAVNYERLDAAKRGDGATAAPIAARGSDLSARRRDDHGITDRFVCRATPTSPNSFQQQGHSLRRGRILGDGVEDSLQGVLQMDGGGNANRWAGRLATVVVLRSSSGGKRLAVLIDGEEVHRKANLFTSADWARRNRLDNEAVPEVNFTLLVVLLA